MLGYEWSLSRCCHLVVCFDDWRLVLEDYGYYALMMMLATLLMYLFHCML
jgi:hypothetical protein